jgi:hypothetical protein
VKATELEKMLADIANQLETDGLVLARESLNGSELSQMANRLVMFAQHLDYAAFKSDELRMN